MGVVWPSGGAERAAQAQRQEGPPCEVNQVFACAAGASIHNLRYHCCVYCRCGPTGNAPSALATWPTHNPTPTHTHASNNNPNPLTLIPHFNPCPQHRQGLRMLLQVHLTAVLRCALLRCPACLVALHSKGKMAGAC